MSKHISLQGGKVALVDDADYARFSQYEWFPSKGDYAVGFIPSDTGKHRLQYMHRMVLQPDKDELVDHINGDTLDNRRSNLRTATQRQNMQSKRISRLSQTGFKGVGSAESPPQVSRAHPTPGHPLSSRVLPVCRRCGDHTRHSGPTAVW